MKEFNHKTYWKPEFLAHWLDNEWQPKLAFGFLFKPESGDFQGCFCESDQVISVARPSDFKGKSGFAIFPFDGTQQGGFLIPDKPLINDSNSSFHPSATENPRIDGEGSDFKIAVSKGIEEIRRGTVQKLVLARKETIRPPSINIGHNLLQLVKWYPQAHITVFYLPNNGCWISASPELLLEQDSTSNAIKTMALAGTRESQNTRDWTKKEREEQQWVSDFIREKIELLHLEIQKESGPSAFEAGPVTHLRTDFEIRGKEKDTFYTLLQMLHPTPAICGTPQEAARNRIATFEGFDRHFYGGFGGIIGESFSRLIVLLRCARIQNHEVTLFAGAGITKDSQPELEWEETVRKMNTIKRIWA